MFALALRRGARPTRSRAVLLALGPALLLAACGRAKDVPGLDTVPPTVVPAGPSDGDVLVPSGVTIRARFSEPMDCASVNGSTFQVASGGVPVAGTVSCQGADATFTPATALLAGVSYTVSISTDVKDQSGNALASPASWSFTTDPYPAAPTATADGPADGDTLVSADAVIHVRFSQPIDCGTVSAATLLVTSAGVGVPGTIACQGTGATFTPASALDPGATYVVRVTTGVENLSGHALAAEATWSFTTDPYPAAPTAAPAGPFDGDALVAPGATIRVHFSAPMDCATVDGTTFLVTTGGQGVAGAVSCAGADASFVASTALAAATTYDVTVTVGARNASGHPLAAEARWSFTTMPIPATPLQVDAVGGQGRIRVSWTASFGATAYDVYYATTAGQAVSAGAVDVASGSPHAIVGLPTAARPYWIAVVARNAVGSSAPSAEVSARADVGVHWDIAESGGTLNAIAWTGTAFVAVGEGGLASSSPDGVTWAPTLAGTQASFAGVASSGGVVVAVGAKGALARSIDDGATWADPAPVTTANLAAVATSGSRWVAVGAGGAIVTSADGLVWTTADSGTGQDLVDVCWAGTQFVALGSGGVVARSADGVTWSAASVWSWGAGGIAWTGTQLVASAQTDVYASADGASWTKIGSPGVRLSSIALSGSRLVAVTNRSAPWGGGGVGSSADGGAWLTPPTTPLSAVAYGAGTFVGVGPFGSLATSADGVSWTARRWSSLDQQATRALTQFEGKTIVVGDASRIWFGSTATGWVQGATTVSIGLRAVAASPDRAVAVASGNVSLSSEDGMSWTVRDLGTWATLNGVVWTGTRFVAVGNYGTILTSADGLSWTAGTSGTATDLNGVATSGGLLVVVGDSGAILTSADGLGWDPRSSGTTSKLNAVTWAGDRFLAVGDGGILSSTDGVAWAPPASGGNVPLQGIAWSGSRAVAIGSASGLVSDDLETWLPGPPSTRVGYCVGWTGSEFLFPNFNGVVTSADGVTMDWSRRFFPEYQHIYFAVGWTGSQLVVSSMDGALRTSRDGRSWTTRLEHSPVVYAFASDETGRTVGVGRDGAILTSADGIAWNAAASGTAAWLDGVASDGSSFVAVGDGGTILRSADGVTWSPEVSGTTAILLAVTFTGSQFVAVGGGTVCTSPDGVAWTARDVGASRTLQSVAWSGTLLVAVDGSGGVLTSPDAITWTPRALPGSTWPFQVIWAGSQFVTAGNGVLTSPDGIDWTLQTELVTGGLLIPYPHVAWTGRALVLVANGVQISP